ncbi:MAG: RNA-binding protein, partial [Pseudomonadota bacterium]
FVILIAVPAIVALLPKDQLLASGERLSGEACAIAPLNLVSVDERPFAALVGVLGDYLKNLWYIFYMTVPLMLLAGLLGSIVAHLIPLETLKDLAVNPLTLLAVGIVGVFMPVPIAFDVVIAGTLLNAGLPVGIIMVLLFTLGSFSIYSFLIVGRAISFRAAGLVAAAVVLLAVVSGLGMQYYQDRQLENAINVLTSDTAPRQ